VDVPLLTVQASTFLRHGTRKRCNAAESGRLATNIIWTMAYANWGKSSRARKVFTAAHGKGTPKLPEAKIRIRPCSHKRMGHSVPTFDRGVVGP